MLNARSVLGSAEPLSCHPVAWACGGVATARLDLLSLGVLVLAQAEAAQRPLTHVVERALQGVVLVQPQQILRAFCCATSG